MPPHLKSAGHELSESSSLPSRVKAVDSTIRASNGSWRSRRWRRLLISRASLDFRERDLPPQNMEERAMTESPWTGNGDERLGHVVKCLGLPRLLAGCCSY